MLHMVYCNSEAGFPANRHHVPMSIPQITEVQVFSPGAPVALHQATHQVTDPVEML